MEEFNDDTKLCLVCGDILTGSQTKYCKNVACKNIAINARNAQRTVEKVVTYPKYICQACGFIMQLNFEPRFNKNLKLYNGITCSECGTKRTI